MVSARPSAAASDARFGARPAAGASPDHLLTPDRPDPAPARPAKSKGKSTTVNIRNWQEVKKKRKSDVEGQRVAVRVDLGGRRISKKKKKISKLINIVITKR